MGAEDYEHPMAFVKHEFEGMYLHLLLKNSANISAGTWKPENLRHIGAETQA
jgi:alpha 1,6-mannosyltransferase